MSTNVTPIKGYCVLDVGTTQWWRSWCIRVFIWIVIGGAFFWVSWFSVKMGTAPVRVLWVSLGYGVCMVFFEAVVSIVLRRRALRKLDARVREAEELGYTILDAHAWSGWPKAHHIQTALRDEETNGHFDSSCEVALILVGDWRELPEMVREEEYAEPQIVMPFPLQILPLMGFLLALPWVIYGLSLLGIRHWLLSLIGMAFMQLQWIIVPIGVIYFVFWSLVGGRCWRIVPGRIQFGSERRLSSSYRFEDYPVEPGTTIIIKKLYHAGGPQLIVTRDRHTRRMGLGFRDLEKLLDCVFSSRVTPLEIIPTSGLVG